MTKRQAFRESDLTRAIRAGVKAGAKVARAEIDPNGRIVVVFGDASGPEETAENASDWRKRLEAQR